jgi:F0F1-type ATP synthase membrane subunit c/vacuolar-type H+-ATPase subunit K
VDANVTVGPIVMACGLFVALGTHASAREVAIATDHTVRHVMRRSALPLARVFMIGAILLKRLSTNRRSSSPEGAPVVAYRNALGAASSYT